jgi:hypothetical protein
MRPGFTDNPLIFQLIPSPQPDRECRAPIREKVGERTGRKKEES